MTFNSVNSQSTSTLLGFKSISDKDESEFSMENIGIGLKEFLVSHNSFKLSIHILQYEKNDFALFIWPSSRILANYLCSIRNSLINLNILELGCGTSLPGLSAAKFGAKVTLTDRENTPEIEENCKRMCQLNQVECQFISFDWSTFPSSFLCLSAFDLIIAADCFYHPKDFEKFIITVVYLLEINPKARLITTYHNRSSTRSIGHLLIKWKLQATQLAIEEFLPEDDSDFPIDSIELYIITKIG